LAIPPAVSSLTGSTALRSFQAAMQLQRDDEAEKERETIAAVVPGAVKYPPQSEEDVLRNLEGHWKEASAPAQLRLVVD
jgi:hypothetical protein